MVIEYKISDDLLQEVFQTDTMAEIEAKRDQIIKALKDHLDRELESIPREILIEAPSWSSD